MNIKALGVGFLLLLGGCTTVETVRYPVTSFPEVALTKDAKVRIVANGAAMEPIAAAIKAEFGKNGGFKVTEEGADYWFVLSGAGQYVQSEPQNKAKVVQQETANGVTDVIVGVPRNLASAALGVSVAVYEAKTLAPVHYFEIPIYAGDNSEAAARPAKMYDASFTREVVGRVKDAFITQKKNIEIEIPEIADAKLRGLFARHDYAGFLATYKNMAQIDLKKFCEDVRTGAYKESDVPEKLSNYYLYLLVRELMTQDPAVLKTIKEEHMLILCTTDYEYLAQTVPVALARLEYKLANVGE